MPIVAAPFEPLAAPTSPDWSGIRAMTWTGADGSVWDLTGYTGGVALQSGVRGLHMPPVDRYTSLSPAVAGSRHRGWRTAEREVFWPVQVFNGDGSQQWTEYDRAFWSTLQPGSLGVWEVVQLSGESRRLACRYADNDGGSFDTLPQLFGWARYGVTLVAENPYWEGDPVARRFEQASPSPFFPGPPFTISSGASLSSATITNPGDVDAYPVYTITGPTTAVSVGYAGNVVDYAASIPDGQFRVIDTRPDRLTVLDQAGTDRWADLGANAAFDAPIPPGTNQPLSLTMTGTGTVTVSLTPQFFRAW